VKTTIGNGTVSSLLYLATASSNDSGTYRCELKNSAIAELSLHILNGTIFFIFSVNLPTGPGTAQKVLNINFTENLKI